MTYDKMTVIKNGMLNIDTTEKEQSFSYCRREIEGETMCSKQCEHCKEYYAPLEKELDELA